MSNPSQDYGRDFERSLCDEINNFLRKYDCISVCYRLTDDNQPIDLLIDSPDIGYIGIECKSTYDISELEMRKVNRVGEFGVGQIERQHAFLRNTGRYGVLALQDRRTSSTFLIPHQYIFNKVENRESLLTIDEVKDIGLKFHKKCTYTEFIEFIMQRCRTGHKHDN